MRLQEFITESAKLWGAKVRVNQPNYVGYVDAQVWAASAQQARTILKQQFNIEDHHVGSVKEIKMKAKEFVKEAYGDSTSLLNRIRTQQGTPTADNPEGRAELRRREQERQRQDELSRQRHGDLMAQLNDIYVVEKEIAAVREMKRQGISTDELDRTLNQAFDRYKQRWNQHHQYDPRATPEEKRNAEEIKQQAEVYMGQTQRVDQSGQLPAPANEALARMAELADVKLNEALNPNLGKILAAANKFASSVANMKIYVDDLFATHLKFGGLTAFVDYYKKHFTDKDYANAKQEVARARQELEQLGVKINYNESFPTDFTLNIPGQSQPYSFNIIKLLKDSMDTFSTKSTNEALSRMADLAGVPLKEEWNANMGEIYEAANDAARALYCFGVLTNPAFVRSEGSYAQQLLKVLGDPEDYEEAAEMALSTLSEYSARLTYNRNSPRMFTLHVPNMEPYTFDVKEVIDTAVG